MFSLVANELQFQASLDSNYFCQLCKFRHCTMTCHWSLLVTVSALGFLQISVCKVKIPGSDPDLALVQPFALSFCLLLSSIQLTSVPFELASQRNSTFQEGVKRQPTHQDCLTSETSLDPRDQWSGLLTFRDPQQALANLPKPQCTDLWRTNAACGQ